MVTCSATWESHAQLLEDIFQSFQVAGLTLKPSKKQFRPAEVKHLGSVLSAKGISVGTDRVQVILDLPKPTTIKEL